MSWAAALLHACLRRGKGAPAAELQLWRAGSGSGSGTGSGSSTPARSGNTGGIPAPEPPSCPPGGRFAPAAFRPLLVFLAGGSRAREAQQFPARANTFLSPITGPSRRLPTLVLDAAAPHCPHRVPPLPACPPASVSPAETSKLLLGSRAGDTGCQGLGTFPRCCGAR